MPQVSHGNTDLHWCTGCDVPLIRGGACPSCGSEPLRIKHTPPGDIRPGFPHDIDEVEHLADRQWGPGAGRALGIHGSPVLLNPCPAPDRLDEVIAGGHVICSVSFSQKELSTMLLLRRDGGARLNGSGFTPEKGYVVCDPTAVPFIMDGMNLLSPGITDCSDGILPGDEVLVIDDDGRVIASGLSRKHSRDMVGTRGMGVKIRWSALPEENSTGNPQEQPEREWKETWDHVVDVNRPHLHSLVKRSVSFIRDAVKRYGPKAAVSYSGGKDSLATLLLTRDAGFELPVMFVDTGIEFPETVEHVRAIAGEMELDLIVGRPRNDFFELVKVFGPPGRDYRWCCKSCKLGPTVSLIREHFPDGVLTFIGQRRYESDTRERKGAVWKNPWVPQQTGASPVQDWTALDVWLYIFLKGARYNPLYERGFQRIGCWLCPSCDLAERELLNLTKVDQEPWSRILEEERKMRDLPEEWIEKGFHRFKKLPPHMVRLAGEMGMERELLDTGRISKGRKGSFMFVDGYGSCADGLSQEGVLNPGMERKRFISLLNIIGPVTNIEGTEGVEVRPEGWSMKRAAVESYSDGTIVIRGSSEDEIKNVRRKLESVIKRTEGCIGCGICVGRCSSDALHIDESGKVMISEEKCIHCGMCLGPCPAESFVRDPYTV